MRDRTLGRVVANEPLGNMVRLSVRVPGWRAAVAGQFALLQAEPSRCFLGRAVSVSDQRGERVCFLIAPVGDGTRELCSLAQGSSLWVLGPLGRGFGISALARNSGRTVIVAGGVGVAPFPLLVRQMAEGYGALAAQVLVLLGFRDSVQSLAADPVREAVAASEGLGLRCRLEVAVEDGSRGPAEKVTDLLERHLMPGDRLAVCGPDVMAAAVWRVCSRTDGVQAWFSLEAKMACGVGSCHGCAIELADGSAARVCHEGPVFCGREVFGD